MAENFLTPLCDKSHNVPMKQCAVPRYDAGAGQLIWTRFHRCPECRRCYDPYHGYFDWDDPLIQPFAAAKEPPQASCEDHQTVMAIRTVAGDDKELECPAPGCQRIRKIASPR